MTNCEKFEQMLMNMLGEEYEAAIDCFIEELYRSNDAEHIELDELFIRWGEFLEDGRRMEEFLKQNGHM